MTKTPKRPEPKKRAKEAKGAKPTLASLAAAVKDVERYASREAWDGIKRREELKGRLGGAEQTVEQLGARVDGLSSAVYIVDNQAAAYRQRVENLERKVAAMQAETARQLASNKAGTGWRGWLKGLGG